MYIYPAIDLYSGKAVRLYKGDYQNMTVYNDDPALVAADFQSKGASHLHLVDLEGAKDGSTPNLSLISKLATRFSMFTEVGGGIRTMDTIKAYLDSGVDRVILGTAAVTDPTLLEQAVATYSSKIAVGIDIKDNYVAIKGWTEQSSFSCDAFFEKMQEMGIGTVICTDISKDGAMQGTNLPLYKRLSETYKMDIIASGGVSSIDDVRALRAMDIHGAIIGKAYYTGAVDLKEAIKEAL